MLMRCEIEQEDGGGLTWPALHCTAAPPDESTRQAVGRAAPGRHKFKSNRHFNRTHDTSLPPSLSCRVVSGLVSQLN